MVQLRSYQWERSGERHGGRVPIVVFSGVHPRESQEDMRLYLDTNVLDHVLVSGEQADLGSWLRVTGSEVLLSDEHLFEAIPIKDERKRQSLLELMMALPREHSQPAAFPHATEVLGEIRRTAPSWLRRYPDTSRISVFLNLSKRRWALAKEDPARLANLYARSYRPVAEDGVAQHSETQKSVRRGIVEGADMMQGFTIGGRFIATPGAQLDDPEWWWRRDGLTIWHRALFEKPPEMRDYVDYLGPYLQPKIDIDEFIDFWLTRVDLQQVRRNAAVSLVTQKQLDCKITHGNASDSLHATYLFDADYFVTADRGFFHALRAVSDAFADAATPLLVDRGADSAVQEMLRALEGYETSASPAHCE